MEDFNDYFKDKDTMIPSLQTLLTVSFAGDVNPNIIKEISDRLAETHSNKQPLKALYYTPYEIFESYAKGQIQIAGLLNFIASASMIRFLCSGYFRFYSLYFLASQETRSTERRW